MITQIDLRHFKCFRLLKLFMRPLTLLTGLNASGKSSVIQALALLHQTMREHEWSTRLALNGDTVQLGTAEDVIDKITGKLGFEIGLVDDVAMYRWGFEGDRTGMSLGVVRVNIGSKSLDNPETLHHLLPPKFDRSMSDRLCRMTYLTAERLGPRETYMLEGLGLTSVVGPTGDNAVSVLYAGRDERVSESVAVRGVPPTRMRQVEARMGSFFPGCELAMTKIPRANAVTLGIRTSRDVDFHRPSHTGFGITQVLPIVVAALSAQRNDLLVIENPEVHLHPAGQAMMGVFLAQVAVAGVQVILETHSDHVLNGVRRAVKNRTLPPEDVALHFFRPRQEAEREGIAQVQSPLIDGDGNIDDWPEDFFDQFDKDMNYFAGWS